VSFLTELRSELSTAGVRGRRRERIVAEFADHLECEPGAELGSPAVLARQFADELGTSRARRTAVVAFGALAVAGSLFGAAVATSVGIGKLPPARSHPLGTLALALCTLAPQFAFASGTLAALRAFWRRHEPTLSGPEATVIIRRAAVAIAAGILSMGSLVLVVLGYPHGGSAGWREFVRLAAGIGTVGLLAAVPALLAAARLRPTGTGESGDILDDFGPFAPGRWRGHPWRVAIVIAAAGAVVIAVAGTVASDPYDGALRGVLEAAAALVSFGLLGPYLGLLPART
jgi:hypothetical protein